MGLIVFWYVGCSIRSEAIAKKASFDLGVCARKTSFSPKGSAHSGGESYLCFKGTRHKVLGDFFEKASYNGWDFTTICPK